MSSSLPVVILGAGPVGLAAAVHLLGRDLEPVVLEAGDSAGAEAELVAAERIAQRIDSPRLLSQVATLRRRSAPRRELALVGQR
jgi:flavin-dependent dehydrogenase